LFLQPLSDFGAEISHERVVVTEECAKEDANPAIFEDG